MPRKKITPPAENPEEKALASVAEAAPPVEPTEPPTPTEAEAPPSEPAPESSEGQDVSSAFQPEEERSLEPPRRLIVRSKTGLNLRAGPGPGFEAYEVLPDGMEVSVLTLLAEGGPQGAFDFRVPGWKYIFTGQKVGWVDARFLELPEAGHG